MCENGSHCSNIPTHPRYHQIAHRQYERALRDAFWQSLRAKIQQENPALIPFEVAHRTIQASGHYHRGITDVDLDYIVGSSGRFRDFDVSYLPRRRALDDRWVNVAQAHLEGVQLPPIKLYKLGDDYYVEDGNHRVSVARVLGQDQIRAQVVELTYRSAGSDAAD